ncbi:MAG TPA: hypothetical protein VNH15_05305 [Elusimicrobiota bacterium]|nr:hypothetical protein [Elusimicrobiota bacterium]
MIAKRAVYLLASTAVALILAEALRLGRYALASRYFDKVLDMPRQDNFDRATDEQNAFIRRIAGQYGIPLVEEVRIFRAHSPHGLMGSNLFSDGQHPNTEGYVLLTNAFSEAAARRLRAPVRPFLNAQDLIRRAGLTPQDLAAAFVNSGQWLFSVSALHYYPGQRLDLRKSASPRLSRFLQTTFTPGLV